MGELILTRNDISDLGLGVKPGRFCFRFPETIHVEWVQTNQNVQQK